MSKSSDSPNIAVTPNDAIKYLNELLAIAPETIETLVNLRIPAPKAIVDHPTVQVQSPTVALDGPAVVGLIGILNGLFGVDLSGTGPIAVVYDDDWKITRFEHNWRTPTMISKGETDG